MARRPNRPSPYRSPIPTTLALGLVGLLLLVAALVIWAQPSHGAERVGITYQGKSAKWWALRAQQARRDANVRASTIRRLRRTLHYSPTIQEAIRLASITYPSFTTARAWQIIRHESWMTANPTRAVNRTPIGSEHASGLYQFLPSTFRSTPYGSLSIWSPYAQSLAAGWMHSHGRTCEWAIGPSC